MNSADSRHRLGLLAVTALSLFGALFARLWFLQVANGEIYADEATKNTTAEVITPGPRGRILDRNGVVLVDNRQSIVVSIDTQQFDALDEQTQRLVLHRLANVLSMGKAPENKVTVKALRARLNDSRYSHFSAVPVAEDVSERDEIYFSEQAARYPGVVVERTTVRDYPYGSLAAHVLGYVGPVSDTQWAFLKDHNSKAKPYSQSDEIGKAGVEATYEKYLRGTPGRQVFEVDRAGKVVREIEKDRVAPRAGDDLYLSIDVKIQYKAEEALQAQLLNSFQGRPGEEAGGLVVNDPTTGQIRAMASYPTYDPRDLVGGISCPTWRDLQGLPRDGSCGKSMATEIKMLKKDDRAPVPKLLNRAIQGGYPPASTFKLASSYAMLKLGMRDPNTTIADPGYVRLCPGEAKGCVKQNANRAAHGYVNLRTALTVSSDVYYYTLGRDIWASRDRLGKDAFQKAVRELGYGADTGIDIPGESAGQIPDPDSEAKLAMALYKADPAYYENDPALAKDAGRWNTGKSADIAIGQQLTATPLQTANAYASLANGGTLWRPTVIEKITAAGEPTKIHKRFEKHAIRHIDWGPNRDALLFGFRGVVDPSGQTYGGTAVTAFQGFPFGKMPLAGKTGTAQTGEYKNGLKRPDNSVFVAFTLGGPEPLAATAMLEHSGSGAGAAAPVIRRTLEPVADGTLADFVVPKDGRIDAESVAQQLSPTGGGVD